MGTKNILAATFASLSTACAFAADEKPNIILFLVDDMGWQDTSLSFGSEKSPLNAHFETPNMERLAARGVMFTNAYACSVSSPSRCSLMTGMNAARHGVTNWTLRYNVKTDGNDNVTTPPDWNVNGIQPVGGVEHSVEVTPLPRLLKQRGYRTIHCGKAHFGAMETPSADPLTMGFDVNIAGHAAGGLATYSGLHRFGHDADGTPVSDFAVPGLEAYWDKDIFATEALTIEAFKELEKTKELKDTPFFLYMAHYAVHVPFEADNGFVDKYCAMGLSEREAAYASMVEGMDKSLGDIMDYLDENDLADNTIIMFMSDNGGYTEPTRSGAYNAPLRSGKGSVYEGGIRVPMIVSWPGVADRASVNDVPVIIEDFFPTILEMAGLKNYETLQAVDGRSFVGLLTGAESLDDCRDLVWHFPNVWDGIALDKNLGYGSTSAIRCGDYKLVYWYFDGSKELYNLREDIGEENDIAEENPEVVDELSRRLSEYLREAGAQRPSLRSDGSACPWPDKN